MEQSPIVSVCLITYNHEPFIRQAIEGVLHQTTEYKYELIIADDYSKDHTRDIIKGYADKYPDIIKLILQERNVGAARNWIDLISAPKSKYIAYFEGDDYWVAPDKLQNQIQYLEQHSDYIACCGNAVYIKNGMEQEKVRNWPNERDISTKDFLFGNDVMTGTIFFRNQFSLEFFNLLKNAFVGDWILFYCLSKKGKFYYTPEVLTAYRIHSEGAWNKLNRFKGFDTKEG